MVSQTTRNNFLRPGILRSRVHGESRGGSVHAMADAAQVLHCSTRQTPRSRETKLLAPSSNDDDDVLSIPAAATSKSHSSNATSRMMLTTQYSRNLLRCSWHRRTKHQKGPRRTTRSSGQSWKRRKLFAPLRPSRTGGFRGGQAASLSQG